MSDAFEHNPDDHEDPAAGPTWLMGAVGVLLLVAILLALTAMYYNVKAEKVQEEVVSRPFRDIEKLRQSQRALLEDEPRWVTRQEVAGEVQALVIPIDRAMDIVVAEQER